MTLKMINDGCFCEQNDEDISKHVLLVFLLELFFQKFRTMKISRFFVVDKSKFVGMFEKWQIVIL